MYTDLIAPRNIDLASISYELLSNYSTIVDLKINTSFAGMSGLKVGISTVKAQICAILQTKALALLAI